MTPTPQEIRDIKFICQLTDPKQWHKRELIRLRLRCDNHYVRVINDNDLLLDKAFEAAKKYFMSDE